MENYYNSTCRYFREYYKAYLSSPPLCFLGSAKRTINGTSHPWSVKLHAMMDIIIPGGGERELQSFMKKIIYLHYESSIQWFNCCHCHVTMGIFDKCTTYREKDENIMNCTEKSNAGSHAVELINFLQRYLSKKRIACRISISKQKNHNRSEWEIQDTPRLCLSSSRIMKISSTTPYGAKIWKDKVKAWSIQLMKCQKWQGKEQKI